MSLFSSKKLFEIRAEFPHPEGDKMQFSSYLASIELLVDSLMPKELFDQSMEEPSSSNISKAFFELHNTLPIIKCSDLTASPSTLSFALLTPGRYLHGVGRFITSMLSHWLIPGRQLVIDGERSLAFRFKLCENFPYFFCENFIYISDDKDLNLIKNNLPNFINEMRINLLAVYHARYISSLQRLSFEEKSVMIQENIFSLFNHSAKNSELSAFDQIQDFLFKVSAEKKLSQIKDVLSQLMTKKPDVFHPDMFDSIHGTFLLLKNRFIAIRDIHYVSRLMSLNYLFKKNIESKFKINPDERYLDFKILPTYEKERMIVGILVSLNLSHDNERFEKNHLKQAIKTILENISFVENSYFSDKRDDKIRSFYIEIEKADGEKFSFEELEKLKKNFPQEVKLRIENVINPIFMPRNDEEILRNIILLSKQIQYVRDIPQVIINYEKQTSQDLVFMIILVRILKPDSMPMKELFSYSHTFLKFSHEEVKTIGILNKKYPKEATIFRLSFHKEPFFRKDFTLDLQKARQSVSEECTKIIGPFRDFNGGMILKQNESLHKLKEEIYATGNQNDFIIENFFYSIYPSTMKGLLPTSVLKELFLLFLEILELNHSNPNFYIKEKRLDNYFAIAIGSEDNLQDMLYLAIAKTPFSPSELTVTTVEIDNTYVIGYLLRTNVEEKIHLLSQTISSSLESFFI